MSHVRKERGAGADRETEASEALTATRRVGGGAQPFVHPTAVIDPGAVLGVEGRLPPQESTAELGRRTLEQSAELILKEVGHRLDNPALYKQHGWCLREGLWKTPG